MPEDKNNVALYLTPREAEVIQEAINELRNLRVDSTNASDPPTHEGHQSTECYLIQIPGGGLAAISFSGGYYHPGTAMCQVCNLVKVGSTYQVHAVTGYTIRVFNYTENALDSNTLTLAVKEKYGTWTAVPLPAPSNPVEPLKFYNTDTEAAPAHACMQIVGDRFIDGVYYLDIVKPTAATIDPTTNPSYPTDDVFGIEYVFNLCDSIAPNDTGECEFASSSADAPTLAIYESNDGEPDILEVWGPVRGSWKLRLGLPGYKVVGFGTDISDEGGCGTGTDTGTGSASKDVIRIVKSSERNTHPLLRSASGDGTYDNVPGFAALVFNNQSDIARSPGSAARSALDGHVNPTSGIWSLVNGPSFMDSNTPYGRFGDGYTHPVPVLVPGSPGPASSYSALAPSLGESCGPWPARDESDPLMHMFVKGLPGWRCVSNLGPAQLGSGSNSKYIVWVIRDPVTTVYWAMASEDWTSQYQSVGAPYMSYVKAYPCLSGAITGSPTRAYDGSITGQPKYGPFFIWLPAGPMHDPNVYSGNIIGYTLAQTGYNYYDSGGTTISLNVFESTFNQGSAMGAGPYLDHRVGTILPFAGGFVPQGWIVCDGTNGSVDLRGRYIMGAGDLNGNAGHNNPGAGQTAALAVSGSGTAVNVTNTAVTTSAPTGGSLPANNVWNTPPNSGQQITYIQRVYANAGYGRGSGSGYSHGVWG